MRAVDIIMKKRGGPANQGGSELTREEIEFLVGGYVAGTIPDYQVSSWLMSVFFNGMTFAETGILTDVMLKSGKTIDLSGISEISGDLGDPSSTSIRRAESATRYPCPSPLSSRRRESKCR